LTMPTTASASASASTAEADGGASGWRPRSPGARAAGLSAGTIEYQDTGGSRPVIVLLHGLMMDASLWDEVVTELSADDRCVAPTLPLGAHRHAMNADAGLSLPGQRASPRSSLTASTCVTRPSSATTPGEPSSSLPSAMARPARGGSCWSRARPSTTSRPGDVPSFQAGSETPGGSGNCICLLECGQVRGSGGRASERLPAVGGVPGGDVPVGGQRGVQVVVQRADWWRRRSLPGRGDPRD